MIDTSPFFVPVGRLGDVGRPERFAVPSPDLIPHHQPPPPTAVPDQAVPSRRPSSPSFPGAHTPHAGGPTLLTPPPARATAPAGRLAAVAWPERSAAAPTPAPIPHAPRPEPVSPSAHDHPLPARPSAPSPMSPLMAIRQPSTAPTQVTRAPAGVGVPLPMEYTPNRDWTNEYGYVITPLARVDTFLH